MSLGGCQSYPLTTVDRVIQELRTWKVPFQLEVYGGTGHGFSNPKNGGQRSAPMRSRSPRPQEHSRSFSVSDRGGAQHAAGGDTTCSPLAVGVDVRDESSVTEAVEPNHGACPLRPESRHCSASLARPLSANSDRTQCSKKSLLSHLVGGEWRRRHVERDSRKNRDRTR